MPQDKLKAQGQQILEALTGLAQLAGGSAGQLGEATKQAGQSTYDRSVPGILGQLLGSASNIPAQQKLQESTAGTQQRLQKMGMENTDPLKDATLKELVKIRKEQVRGAAEAGMPLEQIAQQAQTMPDITPQAETGLKQNQPQPQQQVEDPRSILEKLLGVVGFRETGASRLANAQADLAIQELAGEKPLQKGEREKLALESVAKLSKEGRLTPQDIFNNFNTGSKDFKQTRDAFTKMTNVLSNPQTGELDFNQGTGDLDLMFGTAKSLDPSGRVTDSDIAIQELATGKYGDKIKKIAQKFSKRGALIPQERKILYEAARRRFQDQERTQEKFVNEMRNLAEKNGIDPSRVLYDTGVVQQSSGNQQSNSEFLQTPGGNSYKIIQ